MGENSGVEWCHHTHNPWWGCTKVSPACKHCYAEVTARRFAPGLWGDAGRRKMASATTLQAPYGWDRRARRKGRRERVFCASMADVFEMLPATHVDLQALSIARHGLWDTIRSTKMLDWLVLTKRPENFVLLEYFKTFGRQLPPNLWLGVTAENPEEASKRIPLLLRQPAAVRFISYEPALGALDLTRIVTSAYLCPECQREDMTINALTGEMKCWCGATGRTGTLDWVIAGGESGSGARVAEPEWYLSVRDQCEDHRVPFFFKQWGAWAPMHAVKGSPDVRLKTQRVTPRGAEMVRVGKKQAGRLLDGVAYDAFPRQSRILAA